MKEATGELNMTVITVVIIAALAVIGGTIVLPAISGGIRNSSCKSMFSNNNGVAENVRAIKDNGNNTWWCCPSGATIGDGNCQQLEQ